MPTLIYSSTVFIDFMAWSTTPKCVFVDIIDDKWHWNRYMLQQENECQVMTVTTSGAGTAYTSGAHEFTPGF
jgi:hypothetical protein